MDSPRSFAVMFAFSALCLQAGCRTDRLHARQAPKNAALADEAFSPVTSSSPAGDLNAAPQQEVDLVEAVVATRNEYHRNLERLREFYAARGFAEKETWARFELNEFRDMKKFRYLMGSEVPSAALKPARSIPEADALYQTGLEHMRQGGHGVPVFYRQDLMVQASQTFRELIEKHPDSDKIDDAAFMLGEIHKEYFKEQESIAATWYERAWTWDPNTSHPARFQAAVVYDYRLHDRDRALELYHAVLENENDNRSNVRFANRRIRQLTDENRGQPPVARVVRAQEPS